MEVNLSDRLSNIFNKIPNKEKYYLLMEKGLRVGILYFIILDNMEYDNTLYLVIARILSNKGYEILSFEDHMSYDEIMDIFDLAFRYVKKLDPILN